MSCSSNLVTSVTTFMYKTIQGTGLCEACAVSSALNLAFTLYRDLLDAADEHEQEAAMRKEAADAILSNVIEMFTRMRAEPDLVKRRAIMKMHAEGQITAMGNGGTTERVN